MSTLLTDEESTASFAAALAPRLCLGDIVFLSGDLGAGKTTLVSCLARALGSSDPVSSPTFSLIHEVRGGRLNLCHADLYRLRAGVDPGEFGLDEYLDGRWVVLIEWPERLGVDLGTGRRWEIRLELLQDGTRNITVVEPEPC